MRWSDGNDENDNQLPGSLGENPGREYLESVLLNSNGAPWNGVVRAFAVNAPNARIATVIDDHNTLTRKRQVWDAGTGDLLWTNQNEILRDLFTPFLNLERSPRFSLDGDCAAFYLNRFEIIVVSVTMASPDSKRINLITLSLPTEINFGRHFALSLRAESLAVVTS